MSIYIWLYRNLIGDVRSSDSGCILSLARHSSLTRVRINEYDTSRGNQTFDLRTLILRNLNLSNFSQDNIINYYAWNAVKCQQHIVPCVEQYLQWKTYTNDHTIHTVKDSRVLKYKNQVTGWRFIYRNHHVYINALLIHCNDTRNTKLLQCVIGSSIIFEYGIRYYTNMLQSFMRIFF